MIEDRANRFRRLVNDTMHSFAFIPTVFLVTSPIEKLSPASAHGLPYHHQKAFLGPAIQRVAVVPANQIAMVCFWNCVSKHFDQVEVQ